MARQRPRPDRSWIGSAYFDVYSSPWFSAVYLLLFVSLVGCVVPEIRTALARDAPRHRRRRRLLRRCQAREFRSTDGADHVLAEGAAGCAPTDGACGRDRRRRCPVAGRGEGIHLRETRNLVFHLALLVVLVAVGYGGLFGWKGNVIVREETEFSDTLTQYDAWGGGRFVDPSALPPFSFRSTRSTSTSKRSNQRGAPRLFARARDMPGHPHVPGRVHHRRRERAAVGRRREGVPRGPRLRPAHFIVKDSTGAVVFDDSVVFLPQDGNFTSTGVIKVPDADPLAFGFGQCALPADRGGRRRAGPHSTFPAADYPAFVSAWTGDLGWTAVSREGVYSLDTSRMTQLGLESLLPGDTWTLPDKQELRSSSSATSSGRRSRSREPGRAALAGAVLAILGLMGSLFIRRRRVWVKVWAAEPTGTLVHVAGLSKTEAPGLAPGGRGSRSRRRRGVR
ncbi:MAG: cytochrome c biogenesis protein ResB [Candidatus Nanopelagicales bacterium]